MARPLPRAPLGDVVLCLAFFTRIPMPSLAPGTSFPAALWAAPLAGAVVGAAVGATLSACLAAGLPPGPAAGLALAAGVVLTGALHEDGLADVADGFGGGRDRVTRLAIMRDSRIGTYGAAALVFSLLLRWAALASLAGLGAVALLGLCIAAHAGSRALLPAFLATVPPARADGLGAGAGPVPAASAGIALALGLAALVFAPGSAVAAVAVLAVLFLALARLCRAKVGGQTGDVLGALQQCAEAAILLVAAATTGNPP